MATNTVTYIADAWECQTPNQDSGMYLSRKKEVSRIGQGRTESFNCVCNVLLHNLGNMYKVFFFFPPVVVVVVFMLYCVFKKSLRSRILKAVHSFRKYNWALLWHAFFCTVVNSNLGSRFIMNSFNTHSLSASGGQGSGTDANKMTHIWSYTLKDA